MNSCAPIIRICRHLLPTGRRCLQPAVRHRSCCRHHLDAQARFHNMARARRRSLILRLRVPMNRHDVALNRIEVMRVISTEQRRLRHRPNDALGHGSHRRHLPRGGPSPPPPCPKPRF